MRCYKSAIFPINPIIKDCPVRCARIDLISLSVHTPLRSVSKKGICLSISLCHPQPGGGPSSSSGTPSSSSAPAAAKAGSSSPSRSKTKGNSCRSTTWPVTVTTSL